jgi:hypothetical protein
MNPVARAFEGHRLVGDAMFVASCFKVGRSYSVLSLSAIPAQEPSKAEKAFTWRHFDDIDWSVAIRSARNPVCASAIKPHDRAFQRRGFEAESSMRSQKSRESCPVFCAQPYRVIRCSWSRKVDYNDSEDRTSDQRTTRHANDSLPE